MRATPTRSIRGPSASLTWNIHKQERCRLAGGPDAPRQVQRRHCCCRRSRCWIRVQEVLRIAGLRWVLASSFMYEDVDIGVLTATRVVPVAELHAACRRAAPPDSEIGGDHVAAASRHGANARSRQRARDQLYSRHSTRTARNSPHWPTCSGGHRGPIVLAGDFNTWSDARFDLVREIAGRLGLVEISYADDRRVLFLGHHVDHVFVRGLDVVAVNVGPVKSSDHNPVEAVLRLTPARTRLARDEASDHARCVRTASRALPTAASRVPM